jgi:hypothetical protein
MYGRGKFGKDNPMFGKGMCGENNPNFGKGISGKDNPMFGRTGDKCPRWNGGRKTRKDGYVLVTAPPNHPHPIKNGKRDTTFYILEHRLVMEKHLGRYLEPDEVIHHIDGNTSNNAIENLRLFTNQAEHSSFHCHKGRPVKKHLPPS